MMILSTLRAVLGSIYARATGTAPTGTPRIVTANAWSCATSDASAWRETSVTASAWPNIIVLATAEAGD